ncbi:hypothetical protein DVS77_18415 [Mycolicibacterium moriokaense]|nr:hypothetical protein DVS77_18415 [Mycolicibacterium moriokaense]
MWGAAVALAATTVVAGCGLTGSTPDETPVQSGRIALAGDSRDTQSVTCTQIQWQMTIDADADPARAHVYLELGGQNPTVRSVNIENLNGKHGVAGGDLGRAEATVDHSTYTITGTAVASDPAKPGQQLDMPFEIKAPC